MCIYTYILAEYVYICIYVYMRYIYIYMYIYIYAKYVYAEYMVKIYLLIACCHLICGAYIRYCVLSTHGTAC